MSTTLIGAALWAISSVSYSWDQWSDQKKDLFIASNVVMVVDWGQTLNLTERYHEGYWEENPWLGKNPSRAHVNKYMAGRIISNYLFAEYLPEPWDRFSLMFSLGTHGYSVINNYNLGLEFKF